MIRRIQPGKTPDSLAALAVDIRAWARELGFQSLGICATDRSRRTTGGCRSGWTPGLHGDMDYMARHGEKRWRPEALVPGTLRVISARMDYRPTAPSRSRCCRIAERAYVSRYALGRDYHKLMRERLARLAERIAARRPGSALRAFVDSAPVLERGVAQKAGLGWIGKNTLLIHQRAGSWFFLGEIYTDLPLPVDAAFERHALRQLHAPASTSARPRVRGALRARRAALHLLPHDRTAGRDPGGTAPADRQPRLRLRRLPAGLPVEQVRAARAARPTSRRATASTPARCGELFAWSAEQFAERAAGTPLYRLGHERWLRNLAVALGNGPATDAARTALLARREHPSELVREHVTWALEQLATR